MNLNCAGCGAPLRIAQWGPIIECAYCRRQALNPGYVEPAPHQGYALSTTTWISSTSTTMRR